jgi:hypothetical protein
MTTKVGQNMDATKRAEYLLPFTYTTILKDQMLDFGSISSNVYEQ